MTEKRHSDGEPPGASGGLEAEGAGQERGELLGERLDDAFSVDPFFADVESAPARPSPLQQTPTFDLPSISLSEVIIDDRPGQGDSQGNPLMEPTLLVSREMLRATSGAAAPQGVGAADEAPSARRPGAPDADVVDEAASGGATESGGVGAVTAASQELTASMGQERTARLVDEMMLDPGDFTDDTDVRLLAQESAFISQDPSGYDWASLSDGSLDEATSSQSHQDPTLDKMLDELHAEQAHIQARQRGGASSSQGLDESEAPDRRRPLQHGSPVPPPAMDVDAALAVLEQAPEVVDEVLDPYEVTGLIVIAEPTQNAAREPFGEDSAKKVAYRLEALGKEASLPAPWLNFVAEMRGEIMAHPEPRQRAAYLHEVADAMRLLGDPWQAAAASLDVLALEISPAYLPALRQRLVDVYRRGDSVDAVVHATRQALSAAQVRDGEAVALLSALTVEEAMAAERRGELVQAREAYEAASQMSQDPFFALNKVRLHLNLGEVRQAAAAMMAAAEFAGEGDEASPVRALWLFDGAELLRRAGHGEMAARLLREALVHDPALVPAWRALELIGWQNELPEVEIEGITGQLAVLVERGRALPEGDERLRLAKRRAAARFFRLGRLLSRQGRQREALQALRDALGVRGHELLFHRALERVARDAGSPAQLTEAIERQIDLVFDPVAKALLKVEAAYIWRSAGDLERAQVALEQSLEVAPDCLPARIALGHLLLSQGRWSELLSLRSDGLGEEPDPMLPNARHRASDAWRRAEVQEFEMRASADATASYVLASKWDPSSGPWLRAAERRLLDEARWEELGEHYDALVLHASSAHRRQQSLLRRARLCEMRGDLNGAIEAFLKFMEGQDAPLERLEELAHLHRRAGGDEAAVKVLEEVVAEGRQFEARFLEQGGAQDAAPLMEVRGVVARSLRWLAHLFEASLNDQERGLAICEELLDVCPGDAIALGRLRRSLERQGRWVQLAELLESQASLMSRPLRRRDLWLESAEIRLRRLRDRAGARRVLTAAASGFPEDQTVQDALERTLRADRDWEALADAMMSQAENHRQGDRHQGARLALEAGLLRRERLDDKVGALEAFELALEIEPDLALPNRAVADLLSHLERWEALTGHLSRWRERVDVDQTWLSLGAEEAWVWEFRLDEPERALVLHHDILARTPDRFDSLKAVVRLNARLRRPQAHVGALRRLGDACADRRDKVALWMQAGRLAERHGLDAELDYRRVLDLEVTHAGARRALERVLSARGALVDLLRFYTDQARLASGMGKLHQLTRIAEVYEKMGRREDASEILKKVLMLAPDYDLARLLLARQARALGDWETVLSMEREMAASAPAEALRLSHLTEAARLLVDMLGRPAEAEPLLREILRLDPSAEGVYEALRDIYGAGRSVEQADALLEVIDARLALSEGAERLSLLREGARLAGERRSEDARRYLTGLLELNPNDGPAMLFAANLAEAVGQVDEAVGLIRRWLKTEEGVGGMGEPREDERSFRQGILIRLASLLVEKVRDYRAAAEVLEEVLKEQPQASMACALMARAQIGLQNPERACSLYKDLFEMEPTATLALQIAWLLDDELSRLQEALAWYMRAQDLDPSSAEAMKGFFRVMRRLEEKAPATVKVRVLRDRLDWLVEVFTEAIEEDPWQVDHFRQLARVQMLRGDRAALRSVAGVLDYFNVASPVFKTFVERHRSGHPERLLAGEGGALDEEAVRRHVLLPAARGVRRRVLGLAWESVAAVSPTDLRRRGLHRAQRLNERDGGRRFSMVNHLARALHLFGIDVYPHPTDPYAVLPVWTPEPSLVIGSAIFERPEDPFHHFRVGRALESLRDGKGLMSRRDAPSILSAIDESLESLLPGHKSLPVYEERGDERWLNDGARRLQRELKRRVRRELRVALEGGGGERGSDAGSGDFITACRRSSLRMGLALCGDFGVAADAIAGTSFSLDRQGGAVRSEVMMSHLREGPYAADIEAMLRFIASKDYLALRERLQNT